MSLGSATRAEFTKFFTTSTWWILGLITLLYLAAIGGGFAATITMAASGSLSQEPDAAVLATGTPTLVYGLAANIGYIFPLLLGVLLVTGEFRHRTLTPTFLSIPRRGLVLTGKLLTGIVVGAILGVVAVLATAAPTAAIFAANGQDSLIGEPSTLSMFGRIVLSFPLWTLIGIGVGSIIRNQLAAIVVALAFTQLVEPTVRAAAIYMPELSDIARYLPSAASDTLTGSNFYGMIGAGAPGSTTEPMQWYVGAAILAAYALVFTLIGAFTTWRRDVD